MSRKRYTMEQLEQVRRTNSLTDYYDILGVTVDCTIDEIAKSYRSHALKLHPDKNSAPGATEATKAMNRAFQVLSDPLSRLKYNKSRIRGLCRRESRGCDSSNLDNKESRSQRDGKNSPKEENTFLYQLLCNIRIWAAMLFLAIVMSCIALFSVEEAYSFVRTSEYRHLRTTHNMGIHFYVKKGFVESKGGVLEEFNLLVEREYIRRNVGGGEMWVAV